MYVNAENTIHKDKMSQTEKENELQILPQADIHF
jgi:hypothetical protein